MPADDEGEGFWRDMLRRDTAGGYEDNATVAAVCLEAGAADLIPFALRAKLTASEVQRRLAAPATAAPATAAPATAAAARGGVGSTAGRVVSAAELEQAAQDRFRVMNAKGPDRLAAVIERRLRGAG